jgi:hypothetical protein
MPTITDTWEAKIRRTEVLRTTQAKSSRDPISMEKKVGVVTGACHPCDIKKPSFVQYSLGKKQDPIFKITTAKRAGRVPRAVQLLPSKHEVLSANPSTTKKNAGKGQWS